MQLTHIQFLTLLYPSRVEARMIIIILGPLALASSGLYFCTMAGAKTVGDSNIPVRDLGDAIRNVFNSTLLLIFGLALAIWGFLVNRNRAWRLDGGTGVFGAGALILAVVTTASSFVAVKEDGIPWLQHLIWAAVLWQTWLGWWWWVGAGMGIGEVEDIMERALRKRRKAARRAHRHIVINNSPHTKRHLSAKDVVKNGTNAVVGFTSSLHHLVNSGGSHGSGPSEAATTARRRRPARDVEEGIEEIELGSVRIQEPVRGSADGSGSGEHRQPASSNSETSSTSRTPSLHPPKTFSEVVAYPTTWLQVYFRRLRREHEEAARKRAIEQAERRSRVPAISATVPANLTVDEPTGWGLGAFGLREAEESTRRVQEANRQIRESELFGEQGEKDSDASDASDSEDGGRGSRRGRLRQSDSGHSMRNGSARTSRNNSMGAPGAERDSHDSSELKTDDEGDVVGELESEQPEERGQWEDVSSDEGEQGQGPDQGHVQEQGQARNRRRRRQPLNPGWSWWGPLREWRLVERNTY